MILSYKHKFVFIKGRKVAGTSTEVLLSDICGPSDIITPITPIDEKVRLSASKFAAQNYGANPQELKEYFTALKENSPEKLNAPKGHFENHISFMKLKEKVDINFEGWTFFAVERCPYRKIISLANMRLNLKDYKESGDVMTSNFDALKKQVHRMFKAHKIEHAKNIDLYKDKNNKIIPKVLRFENLEKDLENLFSNLGIKHLPKLHHLKQGLNSNLLDPKDLFTSEQINLINHLYHEEFESFNYTKVTI